MSDQIPLDTCRIMNVHSVPPHQGESLMAPRLAIAIGTKFTRWTIIGPGVYTDNRSRYPCRCECGREGLVDRGNLRAGKSTSCGCLGLENRTRAARKHGDSGHGKPRNRLYGIWQAMIGRCHCKTNRAYLAYGGRGIIVCQTWRHSYESFKAWAMANGYADNLTLHRIKNDGSYDPGNCKWATLFEQANNTRTSRWLTAWGEKKTLAQWTRDPRCKVHARCIHARLLLGWSVEDAISRPRRIMRDRLK